MRCLVNYHLVITCIKINIQTLDKPQKQIYKSNLHRYPKNKHTISKHLSNKLLI